MRTMKDVERLMIIIRVFLHLNGPATAQEILNYIEKSPINIQSDLTVTRIGQILRGKDGIRRIRAKGNSPRKYWVEVKK